MLTSLHSDYLAYSRATITERLTGRSEALSLIAQRTRKISSVQISQNTRLGSLKIYTRGEVRPTFVDPDCQLEDSSFHHRGAGPSLVQILAIF